VTVPVRNEAPRLRQSILELRAAFERSGFDYQLSIAEDGSTDGTKEVLRDLQRQIPDLLVQEHPGSLGRGKALRMLWSSIDANVYCFTDTDLAAGAEAMVAVARAVAGGEDVVVGSRYAPGAVLNRPPVRSLISQAYNSLLRFTFEESIRDHQCGLKAFSADAIRHLIPISQEDSWFWDTEMIVLALNSGYTVTEMPVTWVERKADRTHLRRLLSDVYLHGTGILRLKAHVLRLHRLIREGRAGPVRVAPPASPSARSSLRTAIPIGIGGEARRADPSASDGSHLSARP